jgi:serine/threonine protein kinase
MSGTPRGTSLYMAPEQLANKPVPASEKSALAIMVYELLVGQTPFEGAHPQAIAYFHAQVMPDPPSQVNSSLPDVLDAVLLRALAKRPEERFASVREFAQAAASALGQHRSTSQSASVLTQTSPLLPPRSGTPGWVLEPVVSLERERDFGSKALKSRRTVVALLAVGSLVATSTAAVLNLNRLEHLLQFRTNANTATPPQSTQKAQPTPTMNTQNQKGTIVGNTQQNANTAVDFQNPADDTSSLLVRLTNGAFVAYERACTHVGVLVNYDPETRMLVCPGDWVYF